MLYNVIRDGRIAKGGLTLEQAQAYLKVYKPACTAKGLEVEWEISPVAVDASVDLVGKQVEAKCILSCLPVVGTVMFVYEWQHGKPVSYLVKFPIGKPAVVLVEDIARVIE